MGLRPHLVAIIGVDNLRVLNGKIIDDRAKKLAEFRGTQEYDDLFWSEIPHYTTAALKDLECMDFEGEEPRRLCYHEVFVYQPEFGLRNIVGCIPPNHRADMEIHSKSVLYVLGQAFGMPGDRAGSSVIRRVADYDYNLMVRRHGKKLRQQYHNFSYGYLDRDFILAQRVLSDFGLEFSIDELELILYWYWC